MLQDQVDLWVIKCATSHSNSFCSNVAEQVAHLWFPFYHTFSNTFEHTLANRGVTIHMPCDSTRFRLLPFDFDYIFLCRNFYNITRNVNNMQPLTLNLRTVRGTGGFTVTWFVTMFENLTNSVSHMVCLIWKFSRGG